MGPATMLGSKKRSKRCGQHGDRAEGDGRHARHADPGAQGRVRLEAARRLPGRGSGIDARRTTQAARRRAGLADARSRPSAGAAGPRAVCASGPRSMARVALVADDVDGRPARKAGTSPASRSASGPPPAGGRTRAASSSSVPVIVDADHVGGAAHSGAFDAARICSSAVRPAPAAPTAGRLSSVTRPIDAGSGHLRHRRHRHLADRSGRRLLAIVRLPGCRALRPGAERRTGREAR